MALRLVGPTLSHMEGGERVEMRDVWERFVMLGVVYTALTVKQYTKIIKASVQPAA